MNCLHNISRLQFVVALTLSMGNFFSGMVFSLQAPFYPREAEAKGLKATQYGLVIGIFELVVFIVSPIIGANLQRLELKRTLTVSVVVEGISSSTFGTLAMVDDAKTFLSLSFVLRIIEACGFAGQTNVHIQFHCQNFP